MPRFLISLILSLTIFLAFSPAFSQQVTTGAIEGTVVDPAGKPLVAATVAVTSKEGTKTTTTDARGAFRFPYLTPGTYSLAATLDGYNKVEHQNVDVKIGSRTQFQVTLQPTGTEKVEVVATAPVIDLSTASTGTSINTDFLNTIPSNRTFSSALKLAPGVVSGGLDESNPSINGASGLENTVVIDGVNIGNAGFGSAGSFNYVLGTLGSGVNFDYLQEIQIKTGGYEPEFGEALGGYVNMITKSGGNQVSGSVFSYTQPGGLEPTRPSTSRNNANFDQRGYTSTDFGFQMGGPIKRDKAFWFIAFDPTFQTNTRQTPQAAQDTLGVNYTLDVKRTIYNYAANVKWLISPTHTFSFSAFGDPSTGDNGPQREQAMASIDPSRKYSSLNFGGHNIIGRWEGQLASNWLGEGSLAYHRDEFKEDLAVNEPGGVDNRGAVAIQYGGVGFFTNSTSKNTQATLKLSNFLEAKGQHQIRYGGQYERIGYDNTTNYSGAPGLTLPDYLGGGTSTSGFQWDTFVDVDSLGAPVDTMFRINRIRSDELSVETKADYWAFFLSDTWNPTKSLSIMAGIRYEQETLHGTLDDHSWDKNWAPRFHVTWDPTKDNRTKLSGAWGRFFGKVPNDLAVRSLSAERTQVVTYPISNVDLTDPNNPIILDPNNIDSTNTYSFGDQATVIDPKAKLTYQDEFVFSAEREVAPFWKVGANYLHRQLGRTLEDVALVPYTAIRDSGAAFGNYYITNPTPELGSPKPSRKYDGVTVAVEKRPNPSGDPTTGALHFWDKVQLGTSYTWSQLKGNYEGYYRRDNSQPDPFITSLFDFPYLEDPDIFEHLIKDEALPNDRTHVFNFYGSYRFPMRLNVGTSVKVQSGNPITKLGFNEVYSNANEIPREERGASGRTPTIVDVGLHADYPFRVTSGTRVNLILNVFNVLNYQKALTVDQMYERSSPTDINPDFGKPLTYQAPRQIQFAARYDF